MDAISMGRFIDHFPRPNDTFGNAGTSALMAAISPESRSGTRPVAVDKFHPSGT